MVTRRDPGIDRILEAGAHAHKANRSLRPLPEAAYATSLQGRMLLPPQLNKSKATDPGFL